MFHSALPGSCWKGAVNFPQHPTYPRLPTTEGKVVGKARGVGGVEQRQRSAKMHGNGAIGKGGQNRAVIGMRDRQIKSRVGLVAVMAT